MFQKGEAGEVGALLTLAQVMQRSDSDRNWILRAGRFIARIVFNLRVPVRAEFR